MSLVFLSFSLHLMDRQSEYMSRLDYRWKRRLAGEQEEAETTRLVNKMLLQNILPIHVAELYLNPDRTQDGVYHEEYENVAVMFASLVDFAPDEIDGHESNEMGSLKLLNTIICDFDKILFEKNILNRVEKIKMAGWTYMAASGLDPGRRDSLISNPEEQTSEHIVPVLVKFAARMMQTLQRINEEKKHTFKLRIGISHGPVTAGVVGAQKPLYDVWGDAVNMASRMDSTGESGKIQVTEETAKILEQQGIQCEYRGPTYVKNKSFVTTYFVCLDENYEVIKSVESDTEEVFDEAL
ncbi:Adenylate cyclase type 2 [Gryllus bimaculatus]|nr:Adenylate cyclase type 2 [Gryllus bimaculatus]